MKNILLLLIFITLTLTLVKASEVEYESHLYFVDTLESISSDSDDNRLEKNLLKCGFHVDSPKPICSKDNTYINKSSGSFTKEGSWFSSDIVYSYSYIHNLNTNIQYIIIKANTDNSIQIYKQKTQSQLIDYDAPVDEEYIDLKFKLILSLETYSNLNTAFEETLTSKSLDIETYTSMIKTYVQLNKSSISTPLENLELFTPFISQLTNDDLISTSKIEDSKILISSISELLGSINQNKTDTSNFKLIFKELLATFQNTNDPSLSTLALSLLNKYFKSDYPGSKDLLFTKISKIEDISTFSFVYEELNKESSDKTKLTNSLLISSLNKNEEISKFALTQIIEIREGNIDTIEFLLSSLLASQSPLYIEESVALFSLRHLTLKQQIDLYIKYFHSKLERLSQFAINKLVALNLNDFQLGQIISDDSIKASIEILSHYDSVFVIDSLIHYSKIGSKTESDQSVKRLGSKKLNDDQLIKLYEVIKSKYDLSNNDHFLLFINLLEHHKNKELSARLFESNIARFSKLKIFNSTKNLRYNKQDKSLLSKLNKDLDKISPRLENKIVNLTLQSLLNTQNLETLKHAAHINDYKFRLKILKKLKMTGTPKSISLIADYLNDDYTVVRRKASQYLINLKSQMSKLNINKISSIITNKQSHWRSQYVAIQTLQALGQNEIINKMIKNGSITDKDILQEL